MTRFRGLARLVVGLLISVVLLALVLRSVDPGKLWAVLQAADLRFVAPAIAIYFVGTFIRSVRWALLLPGGVPVPTLFRALAVGFTANNLLPARLGELARAYLLNRWCAVPYGDTIASVVVERILDGLALAVLLLAALLFIPAPGYLLGLGLLVGGGFCVGAAMVALAAWQAGAVLGLARFLARPLPHRFQDGAERLALGFVRGLRLVRGPGRLLRLGALSLLGWCAEMSVFYLLLFSLQLPPWPGLALLSGAVGNFATLIPSSPGYVGTFDGAVAQVLVDVATVDGGAISREVATAYAFLVHATLLLPVTVLGGLILWRSNLSLGQITHARPTASVKGRPPQSTLAPSAVPPPRRLA